MNDSVAGARLGQAQSAGAAIGSIAAIGSRVPLADAMKAIAAQCIVLHHLAAYGPMPAVAQPHLAGAVEFIYDHGRAAVFVFLVLGGYMAAGSLMPAPGQCSRQRRLLSTTRLVGRRWIRLAWPYWFALVAAVASAAFARRAFDDIDTPAAPALFDLLANGLMLQDILGVAALSAGVWYVAIDLQLFAALAVFTGAWKYRAGGSGSADRAGGAGPACVQDIRVDERVSRLAAISLICAAVLSGWFVFGHDDDLDAWVIYYFGAYGMGVLARWAAGANVGSTAEVQIRSGSIARWRALLLGLCIAAVLIDFRLRTFVTVGTALALARGGSPGWTHHRLFKAGSRMSYSLFLIHYPVCLLVNTLVHRAWGAQPMPNLLGLVLALLASNLAAWLFHDLVESRAPRIVD